MADVVSLERARLKKRIAQLRRDADVARGAEKQRRLTLWREAVLQLVTTSEVANG